MPDTIAAEDKKIFHIHTVEDCSAELQAPKKSDATGEDACTAARLKKIPGD